MTIQCHIQLVAFPTSSRATIKIRLAFKLKKDEEVEFMNAIYYNELYIKHTKTQMISNKRNIILK